MIKIDTSQLIKIAIKARDNAYSPYSNFKVGSALLCSDCTIFEGANIESASYTPTNCAERTAFFKAVYEGHKKFESIAIVGGYDNIERDFCYPCGVCRQVMMEFCDPKTFKIIVAKDENNYKEYILEELLPYGFGPKDIEI